jgi:hypothetical protein
LSGNEPGFEWGGAFSFWEFGSEVNENEFATWANYFSHCGMTSHFPDFRSTCVLMTCPGKIIICSSHPFIPSRMQRCEQSTRLIIVPIYLSERWHFGIADQNQLIKALLLTNSFPVTLLSRWSPPRWFILVEEWLSFMKNKKRSSTYEMAVFQFELQLWIANFMELHRMMGKMFDIEKPYPV